MKFLMIISLLAVTACVPTPSELPENFNPEFAF